MSVLFYDGVDHMIKKITTLLKGKADSSHKHTKSDITDFPTLGTASSKDVASSGNASTTQVVMGNDTRLSDARKASDVYAWAKASTKPSYTKSEVGLENVDNTSDTSKPVSTAQQTAIDTAYANANKYTDKKVADLIGSAPETMDTLEEVAAAIQENKDVETALNSAIGTKANQTELDTHTGNSTIHITASERTNWNTAKTHADSTHARTDATKVEKSSTNGNIKINGTETTVYTHPSGTNPHGTTKSDVGLGNVGNFKAVSTVASQGLTDTEKVNARANIGAGTSSFSGSYNDLSDKPTIPSNVTESTVSGWGFTKNTGTYSKPSTGIPKTDLASAVQTSLGKADTALQSHQDISGKQDKSTAVTHTANTAVGSVTQPVYIAANGTATATTYTLGKSVPSDAKFTDTTYTSKSAVSGGTDVSLVTTGEKATWNAKTSNYEIGTWTPNFWSNNNVKQTPTKIESAIYRKIGNLCYIYVYAYIIGGSLSIKRINGLPFAPSSSIHTQTRPSMQTENMLINGKSVYVNTPSNYGQIEHTTETNTEGILIEGFYNI